MAILRNIGHTSCQALVSIAAGASYQGALKDKGIVSTYEQKTTNVLHAMSEQRHADIEAEETAIVLHGGGAAHADGVFAESTLPWTVGDDSHWGVDAIEYAGYSSTNEAIDKEKVHVSHVTTYTINLSQFLNNDAPTRVRDVPDLQTVADGSAETLRHHVQRIAFRRP